MKSRPRQDAPRESVRSRRLISMRLGGVAALALLLAAGGWALFRSDLPRRKVESLLAGRLSADVSLGRFTIVSPTEYRLDDLTVRRLSGVPVLASVHVASLLARGDASAILDGSIESVEIAGLVIEIAVPPGDAPPAAGAAANARIGRLTVRAGKILLPPGSAGAETAAGPVTPISFDLDLESFGDPAAPPRGSLSASAPRFDPAVLSGWIPASTPIPSSVFDSPSLAVHFAPERILMEATAAGVILGNPGGTRSSRSIPGMSARLEFDHDTDWVPSASASLTGMRAVSLDARADGLAHVTGHATCDPANGRIRSGSLLADQVDIAGALALAGDQVASIDASGHALLRVDLEERPGANRVASTHLALRFDSLESEGISAAGEVELDGSMELAGEARPFTGSLTLRANRLAGSLAGRPLPGGLSPALIRANAGGTVRAGGSLPGAGTGSRVALDLHALLETSSFGRWTGGGAVRASLPPSSGEDTEFDLRIDSSPLPVARILSLLPQGLAAQVAHFAADGIVTLGGRVRGNPDSFAYDASPGLSGFSARVENLESSITSVAISATSLTAHLSGPVSGGVPGPVEVSGLEAGGTLTLDPLAPRLFSLRAKSGRFDMTGSSLDLSGIELDLPGLARLAGSLTAGKTTGRFHAATREPLDLPFLIRSIEPITGTILPPGEVRGTGTFGLDGTFDRSGALRAGGALTLAGIGAESGDGARVLQDLGGTLTLEAGRAADGALRASARGDLGKFEALWGDLYVNGAEVRAHLDVEASLPADAPASVALKMSLPGGVTVAGTVSLEDTPAPASYRWPWTLRADIPDIADAWARSVLAPLGESVGDLARFEPGGAIEAELSGILAGTASGSGGSARGIARLRAGRLAGEKGTTEARGVAADIPLEVDWTRDAQGTLRLDGPPRSGSFAFDRLVYRGLEVPPISTAITVQADSVTLDSPAVVPLLGGQVELSNLSFGPVLSDDRRLGASLAITGVDLALLLRALELTEIPGTIEAAFPAVTLSAERFVSEGGGSVQVFGGSVKFGRVTGSDIFTSYPRLNVSAGFEDIDLDKVTGTFDIGRMTGIVRGSISDCELFAGVPTRFTAEFESVERRGVRQSLDVRAIQNIAIVGSGGEGGGIGNIFDRGIHRFFRRYPYEKLGALMALGNDSFLLRGLAYRGERELLLKGRNPLRVDVVIVQPGQTVSFQTMMDRIGEMDFGGVTTSRGPGAP